MRSSSRLASLLCSSLSTHSLWCTSGALMMPAIAMACTHRRMHRPWPGVIGRSASSSPTLADIPPCSSWRIMGPRRMVDTQDQS